MTLPDYLVILLVLLFHAGIGIYFARRAGRDTGEFILGGRNIPWWLAGVSVIATGLNTNTPLVDGRKIRNDGISGQWFQWQAVISNAIGAIWLFRLWRRAGITTPMEFYAIRYRSKPAQIARIGDVAIIGVFNGCLWTVAGLVGFKKIARVLFDLPPVFDVLGCTLPSDWVLVGGGVILALTFSTLAGLYSVLWTDMLELLIAMGCTYALFFMVYAEIGWNVGLRAKIESLGSEGHRLLGLLPEFGPAMLVLFFLQPLISQGQWNGNVQRMLCLRDEREVLRTAIFSQLVNWVFRPWPFLILGLCGIFLVGDEYLLKHYAPIITPSGRTSPDYEMVFPSLVRTHFSSGFVGLMMAGFLISFMGSLASNVHSSAAVFVNDLYRPFLARDRAPRHYVFVSRLVMIVLTLVAVILAVVANNILSLVIVALTVNNASGIVKLLRFVWWRINGWAELGSQVCGLVAVATFFSPAGTGVVQALGRALGQQSNDAYYAIRVILVFIAALVGCLAGTFLARPEADDILASFYRRVRPYGWWGPIARDNPESRHTDSIPLLWAMLAAFLAYVFGGIFALVGLLFAFWGLCAGAFLASLAGFLFLRWGSHRLYRSEGATGSPAPGTT